MTHTRILVLLFTLSSLFADESEITGVVRDALSGVPLPGAEIVTGGLGTVADATGTFRFRPAGDSLRVRYIGYRTRILAVSDFQGEIYLQPAVLQGSVVEVRSGLVRKPLLETTGSLTRIEGEAMGDRATHYFAGVMDEIPNLNWAGGTARPRYLQIRGIGERSQFAGDGPPNFSVGFSLDDIELSGMGMAGILFDLADVEVFRGVQSSVFGPNTLAGSIQLHSNSPGAGRSPRLELGYGNANTYHLGYAGDVLLRPALSTRLAVYLNHSDGFVRNRYLHRKNTQYIDEQLVRVRTSWEPTQRLRLLITLMRTDLQNGYDGWSPDNNQDFITWSDEPGVDDQLLNALAIRTSWRILEDHELLSITTLSQSMMRYSYDGDWGNDDFWAADPYGFDLQVDGMRYSFRDDVRRRRDTRSQEFRFSTTRDPNRPIHWVTGVYFKNLAERDDATGWLFGGDASELHSRFDLEDLSVYGELDWTLSRLWRLESTFRTGRRNTDYKDDQGTTFQVEDQLSGGRISLQRILSPGMRLFASASRGFKAGGINQHPRIAPANRPFDPEYMDQAELGIRRASQTAMYSAVLFQSWRRNQQVNVSSQQTTGNPNSFIYYIANASTGTLAGMEFEGSRTWGARLRIHAALGLLQAHTDSYTFPVSVDDSLQLGDRTPAQAPAYTYRWSVNLHLNDLLTFQGGIAGKDWFFFSGRHDERSDPYTTLDAKLQLHFARVRATLWGRNLMDTRYAVRGFYFALEPPDYTDKRYVSYGTPREYGLTLSLAIQH